MGNSQIIQVFRILLLCDLNIHAIPIFIWFFHSQLLNSFALNLFNLWLQHALYSCLHLIHSFATSWMRSKLTCICNFHRLQSQSVSHSLTQSITHSLTQSVQEKLSLSPRREKAWKCLQRRTRENVCLFGENRGENSLKKLISFIG